MYTHKGRQLLWHEQGEYAVSHCQKCEAGWTRTGAKGGTLTVCLLDREPVMADMVNCDRFEAKQA